MLKLKVLEKEYEVSNCSETIIWTGNKREEFLNVMLQDIAKDDLSKLVGQQVNGTIENNTVVVVTLNAYRVKEVTKNYNFDVGINVRFEKVTV